jgi:hypothetical protein
MLCVFISSNPSRLLQPNTQQSTSSDKGFDGQYRMGEAGEENIPETQSRDKIGWHVRINVPSSSIMLRISGQIPGDSAI